MGSSVLKSSSQKTPAKTRHCSNSILRLCFVSLLGLCMCFLVMQDTLFTYLDSFIDKTIIFQQASRFMTYFGQTSGFAENEAIQVKFMTPYFGGWVDHWRDIIQSQTAHGCPAKCAYNYTEGPANGTGSQVLIFHANDLAEHPEYLPSKRVSNQIWLLMNAEAPWLTQLAMSHHNNIFNWTSFLRNDSDTKMYYFKTKKLDTSLLLSNSENPKKKHAYWMVSNCYATNSRDAYMDALKRHIRVDVYSDGICQAGALRCAKGEPRCEHLADDYNFYMAFENANCRDYISEKLWRSLTSGVIPVVMGDSAGYKRVAPPGSYIDTADFTSPKKLAEYMIKVEQNLTLYRSYFSWRRDYEIVDEWLCDVCQSLHNWDGTHQVYSDLSGWHDQDTCNTWNVVGNVYSRTSVLWRVVKRWTLWTLGLSHQV